MLTLQAAAILMWSAVHCQWHSRNLGIRQLNTFCNFIHSFVKTPITGSPTELPRAHVCRAVLNVFVTELQLMQHDV